MAPMSTFKAFVVLLVMALFSAAASVQDFNPSASPAQAPDAGAAGDVSSSVVMIGASVVLSMLAILKH